MVFKMDSSNFDYIAKVKNEINDIAKMPILGVKSEVSIQSKYLQALHGLEGYSHIIIIGYLHKINEKPSKKLITHPNGDTSLPKQGLFALRGRRPNLISFTVCKLLSINNVTIIVDKLDLLNETPIFDVKPYLPFYDSIENATMPKWTYS